MTEDDMARDEHAAADEVRRERWDCTGPAELDLSIDLGRLELTLGEADTEVRVELRQDPRRGAVWNQGLSGLLNWIGESTGRASSMQLGGRNFSFGGADFDPGELLGHDLGAEAVRAAEISWSEPDRRLVVRSSTALPLRVVPLVVSVRAPAGSRLTLRAGAGDVTVTGRAGDTAARTGSGDVRLDAVDGDVEVTAGSGEVSVGAVQGRARAKTGSGDLSVAALGGPAEVRTGSGEVRLGGVRADLFARTGSGDLTISDAEAGRLELTTGSGDLRIGVHAGAAAELDLSSGSGRTRSELEVSPSAPSGGGPALVIRGRTGSGDVTVTRALASTG